VALPAHITTSSRLRETVYGICWHLAEHHDPLPFDLSRERLAEVLHMEKSGVSSIVSWLVDSGLIAPLDVNGNVAKRREDEFYKRNVRCKRYHLQSRIEEKMQQIPSHIQL
jgi:predicted transcriptional regulator